MFFTLYEFGADATMVEVLTWFALHVMMQIVGASAFVMLLILAFSIMGICASVTYWSMLPVENNYVGWFASLPVIFAGFFFTRLAVKMMVRTWKQQRRNMATYF